MSTSMKKVLAKAKKVMHPNSRKSIAITKKTKKITNREKLKLGNAMRQNLIGEKMMWMRDNMLANVSPYTPELAADLLKRYMSRYDGELEQITIKHSIGGRKNRQHASREDIINMTKKREETEYETCGIEIPDIFNPAQCEMLRKWDGELRYLPNFKFTRFGKSHLLKAIRNKEKSSKEPAPKFQKNPNKLEAEEDETNNTTKSNNRSKTNEDNVANTKNEACSMDVE